jgi:hypothetical protein
MRSSIFQIAACAAVSLLFAQSDSPALAQTTSTVNPPAAELSGKEQPPPGGCMPIGLTVSGEVVFPFQCKDFIERLKTENKKPDVTEEAKHSVPAEETPPDTRPAATDEKPTEAAKQGSAEETPGPANAKSADTEDKTGTIKQPEEKAPKASEGSKRLRGLRCTHFRTYDEESRTYRDYQGRRRPCRI